MLIFLISSVFIGCKNFQQIEPIYGIPNVDDDDQNGVVDWDDELPDDEDDLSELVIPKKMFLLTKLYTTIYTILTLIKM